MTTYKDDLLGLGNYAFGRLRDRVRGLTDEEYLWEPVPGCWSIRPDPADEDGGRWRSDGGGPWLPTEPPPFTTIGWRLAHIIELLSAERNATWIGLPVRARPVYDSPAPTAGEALHRLDEAYAFFRGQIEAVDPDTLGDPMGPIATPYDKDSRGSFVLHELDELIHHGSEVAVVRDLYAASRPPDPIDAAALAGDREGLEALLAREFGSVEVGLERLRAERPELAVRAAARLQWDAVRLLHELGFDVAPSSGTTPAHYAAGSAGRVDVLRWLVEQGARLDIADPAYQATPLEWARYFERADAVAYLESLESPGP